MFGLLNFTFGVLLRRTRTQSVAGLCLISCPFLQAAWTLDPAEKLDAPAGLEFARLRAAQGAERVELHLVTFDTRTHTLAVMDNPEGAFDLGSASQRRGVLAAVNGGYFHPDKSPLGLVVRQGKTLHPLERARLLSGLVVVTRERVALLRVAELKLSPGVREALQAGPFLVDRGKPVVGLDAKRDAARTVVLTDGARRFGLLVCHSATLREMAELLTTPGLLPAGRVTRALNLDGGSSTALWVKQEPRPLYLREWKGVRNYLGIVSR
ncbi:MAG: phosphodiester glycosidase family protein [Verrucomicrobiota bacterium]|nr:phosphodiester glycosidase family protein [Verrucomicrobiota bacterium]